ncbi:MAG: hypothetical protein ABSB01_27175 [Streptosporangiaceae bacterium]|jgi:hypothetical protein
MTHPASGEAVPDPSYSGSVVLDLGLGTGALVLYAPPEADGREIEISLVGESAERRTHSRVRPRKMPDGTLHAAVYPGLSAGDYTVWLDSHTPGPQISITGGRVTTYRWPE